MLTIENRCCITEILKGSWGFKLDTGRNIQGYTKEDLHASSYRDNSLHRNSDYSMARECRLLKKWTGL